MQAIQVTNTDLNLVVDVAGTALWASVGPPPTVEVAASPDVAFNVTIPGPVNYLVSIAPQPILEVSLSGAGIQGPAGPPGPRGSLFLGGYPSFVNLPVPDGVNVRVGDFALVKDESAIYELE